MSTYVYQYKILDPVEHGDIVMDRIKAGGSYYNDLIEVRRDRRAVIRELLGSDDIEALRAELKEAKAETKAKAAFVKRARSKARSRGVTSDEREELRLLRDRESQLKKRIGELAKHDRQRRYGSLAVAYERATGQSIEIDALAKMKAKERVVVEDTVIDAGLSDLIPEVMAMRAANDAFNASSREARANSGLASGATHGASFGTYQAVEERAQVADTKTKFYRDGEPHDPRFQRFDGSGCVAVHIQSNPDFRVSSLYGSNNWAMVDPIATWTRNGKRHLPLLRMRVGTNQDGTPIMAAFPIITHRPMPRDARVLWVKATRRRIGPSFRWSCEITVTIDGEYRTRECGTGTVAVQLLSNSGSMVALTMDQRGHSNALVLPDVIGENAEGVRTLASTRKGNLNTRIEVVRALAGRESTPEWFMKATAHAHQWRSARKLVYLLTAWEASRWAGDEDDFESLRAWLKQDRHLWSWERFQWAKLDRRRREQFRLFAVGLVKQYGRIVMLDVDLAERKQKRAVGDDEKDLDDYRSKLHSLALGELRRCIEAACRTSGAAFEKVDVQLAARTCPNCGNVEPRAHAKFVCTECDFVADTDKAIVLSVLRAAGHGDDVERIVAAMRAARDAVRNAGRASTDGSEEPLAAE